MLKNSINGIVNDNDDAPAGARRGHARPKTTECADLITSFLDSDLRGINTAEYNNRGYTENIDGRLDYDACVVLIQNNFNTLDTPAFMHIKRWVWALLKYIGDTTHFMLMNIMKYQIQPSNCINHIGRILHAGNRPIYYSVMNIANPFTVKPDCCTLERPLVVRLSVAQFTFGFMLTKVMRNWNKQLTADYHKKQNFIHIDQDYRATGIEMFANIRNTFICIENDLRTSPLVKHTEGGIEQVNVYDRPNDADVELDPLVNTYYMNITDLDNPQKRYDKVFLIEELQKILKILSYLLWESWVANSTIPVFGPVINAEQQLQGAILEHVISANFDIIRMFNMSGPYQRCCILYSKYKLLNNIINEYFAFDERQISIFGGDSPISLPIQNNTIETQIPYWYKFWDSKYKRDNRGNLNLLQPLIPSVNSYINLLDNLNILSYDSQIADIDRYKPYYGALMHTLLTIYIAPGGHFVTTRTTIFNGIYSDAIRSSDESSITQFFDENTKNFPHELIRDLLFNVMLCLIRLSTILNFNSTPPIHNPPTAGPSTKRRKVGGSVKSEISNVLNVEDSEDDDFNLYITNECTEKRLSILGSFLNVYNRKYIEGDALMEYDYLKNMDIDNIIDKKHGFKLNKSMLKEINEYIKNEFIGLWFELMMYNEMKKHEDKYSIIFKNYKQFIKETKKILTKILKRFHKNTNIDSVEYNMNWVTYRHDSTLKSIMLNTNCIDIFMYYVYFIPFSPKYMNVSIYNDRGRETIIGSKYKKKIIQNVYKIKTKYKIISNKDEFLLTQKEYDEIVPTTLAPSISNFGVALQSCVSMSNVLYKQFANLEESTTQRTPGRKSLKLHKKTSRTLRKKHTIKIKRTKSNANKNSTFKTIKENSANSKNKTVNQNNKNKNSRRLTVNKLRVRKQTLLPPIEESRRQPLKINVRETPLTSRSFGKLTRKNIKPSLYNKITPSMYWTGGSGLQPTNNDIITDVCKLYNIKDKERKHIYWNLVKIYIKMLDENKNKSVERYLDHLLNILINTE